MKALDEALNDGRTGTVLKPKASNPQRLCEWRVKTGIAATGKMVDGVYKVVFWHKIE